MNKIPYHSSWVKSPNECLTLKLIVSLVKSNKLIGPILFIGFNNFEVIESLPLIISNVIRCYIYIYSLK